MVASIEAGPTDDFRSTAGGFMEGSRWESEASQILAADANASKSVVDTVLE